MTSLLVGAVVVLFVCLFLLAGAVAELLRDVRQLQEVEGLLDKLVPVEFLAMGSRPSVHGLPERLDDAEYAVILMLSDRCGTCASLLVGLKARVPEHLVLLIEAANYERTRNWLALAGLGFGDDVLFDEDEAIAASVSVFTTPVALIVENGVLARGTTVPSSRQLQSILQRRGPIVAAKTDEKISASVDKAGETFE
jgi:hypothetical protein